MNTTTQRTVRIALLLWMLGQCGLFLLCIQLTAWTQMTNQLSRYMPANEAFELILEGQEICGMCDFVQKQTSLKKQSVQFASSLKLTLLTPTGITHNLALHNAPQESKWQRTESKLIGCQRAKLDPPPPKAARV
ncbi:MULTISPECIES: hypothetical protein [unclassified Lentimonas]|uniref:hypothetical protein n=1 Tax=unclassified Lentimonas TaxID=2630993 RepID=UPI00138994FF|nr:MULTISPECIES: hypothetical protein [unclassified Lentimonas]